MLTTPRTQPALASKPRNSVSNKAGEPQTTATTPTRRHNVTDIDQSPENLSPAVEVPPFHAFLRPALTALSDGAELASRAIVDEVVAAMSLDADQIKQTITSGQGRVQNRIQWALSYLFQAGAVQRPQRGHYRITERGTQLLASHPNSLSVADLRQFPEFQDFQTRTRTSTSPGSDAGGDEATPLEQIETASVRLDSAVSADLVERIRQQAPEFLEKAVVQLLVAMGYGGSHGDGQHLGGSGDGGFDGVINQDPLGLGRIYVQAKRYAPDNVVGRPAVQGFLGALHAAGAAGGVFISTSRFSGDAISFAESVSPRVILIDGPKLGELLVRHRIGVEERDVFRVVEVDEDFFE